MIARETLCGLVFVLSAAGAVAAQTPQPGSTQVITGVVQDETGAVLPGAALDLLAPGGAVVQSTQADSAGVFRFDAVAAGTYQMRARFEGFAPGATRLRVVTGRTTAQLKIVLRIGSLTDEITVTNGPTQVDPAALHNLDGVTVDKAMLDGLPVFDQDVIAAASRFLDASALGTGGATIVVDGMEARPSGEQGHHAVTELHRGRGAATIPVLAAHDPVSRIH